MRFKCQKNVSRRHVTQYYDHSATLNELNNSLTVTCTNCRECALQQASATGYSHGFLLPVEFEKDVQRRAQMIDAGGGVQEERVNSLQQMLPPANRLPSIDRTP